MGIAFNYPPFLKGVGGIIRPPNCESIYIGLLQRSHSFYELGEFFRGPPHHFKFRRFYLYLGQVGEYKWCGAGLFSRGAAGTAPLSAGNGKNQGIAHE